MEYVGTWSSCCCHTRIVSAIFAAETATAKWNKKKERHNNKRTKTTSIEMSILWNNNFDAACIIRVPLIAKVNASYQADRAFIADRHHVKYALVNPFIHLLDKKDVKTYKWVFRRFHVSMPENFRCYARSTHAPRTSIATGKNKSSGEWVNDT